MRIVICLIMLFGLANSFSQQKSWLISKEGKESACKNNRDWLEDRCGCNNSDLCCVSCAVQIFAPAVALVTTVISGCLTPICCPSCGLITVIGIPCLVGSCALGMICHCVDLESARMYPDEVRRNGMSKDPYENL